MSAVGDSLLFSLRKNCIVKSIYQVSCLSLNTFHFLTGALSGVPVEAIKSSRFCELLLRIDTMVISGMINMQEASDLREKVVNNRNIIQSTFSDIHHKANTELLSELRLFLRKPIEYATLYLCPNCYSYCLSFKDSTIQLHVLVPFSIHFNDPGHARQHSNSYILAIHISSSVITKLCIYFIKSSDLFNLSLCYHVYLPLYFILCSMQETSSCCAHLQ